MDWIMFRPLGGSIPFWPKVAASCGDPDKGLLLSVCASLTARSRGPFVRYESGGLPRWDAVLPVSRYRMSKLLSWLFDDSPDGDDPVSVIRRTVRRTGPIHHFHDNAVLKAMYELAGESGSVSGGVRPGKIWWEGPVSSWKSEIIGWLVDSGFDEGVGEDRLQYALECLLDELYRDVRDGSLRFDDSGKGLTSYVKIRYTPQDETAMPFLRYDVLWGDIRRLTGMLDLRPTARSVENRKLRRALLTMLAAVQDAGVHHLDYLRCLKRSMDDRNMHIRLRDVLNVQDAVLRKCR